MAAAGQFGNTGDNDERPTRTRAWPCCAAGAPVLRMSDADDTRTVWLPLSDAAPLLRMSLDTLRRRVREGAITARKDNAGRHQVEVPVRDSYAADAPDATHSYANAVSALRDRYEADIATLRGECAELRAQVQQHLEAAHQADVARVRAEAERDGIRIAAEAEKSAIAVVVTELKAQLEHSRRPWWRRWLATLATCLALATSAHAAETLTGRARAIDGDTIVVAGMHVRLKGVDAPEIKHPGQPEPERGKPEAAAFVHRLVDGRTAVCELTQECTHGRRVGYCEVDGQDVAAAVIGAGLARACPRYSRRYVDMEQPVAARLPQHQYCLLRHRR